MVEEVKPVEVKKKKEKKGKKKHVNKPTSQKWKMYKTEGGKLIREKSCPRCGPGIFLAKSKGKLYCGKCAYTEFSSSK
ncbi:30S ribosomal protein S27ae [Candidatus Pacearchaeota archaeon]|nr:30S ribosomal protein S27ae [Candidatus Pacearchaeota archaeon]